MKVGIVVPHIFMQDTLLADVIFSPGPLAIDLVNGLAEQGADVTLFSPGVITSKAHNITADLSYFEHELTLRGDTYLDLLKKHPLTFITLARQVQGELIAKAYSMANNDELDIVHIYTNEEDTALPFASLCQKPVVFTHHDPFNFLINYRSLFPKYPTLNWISLSNSQRSNMPDSTNWLATIYHGLPLDRFAPNYNPVADYIAYFGRIIEPKGVHLAIAAVKQYNKQNPSKRLKLKIAGKHYAGKTKNSYWEDVIKPEIDSDVIQYRGFIKNNEDKQDFLGNAKALMVASTFDEPFGMVMIEALACATPVIGLRSGAIPEVIENNITGKLVRKTTMLLDDKNILDQRVITANLAQALVEITDIDRNECRRSFEQRFTLKRMCQKHIDAYKKLLQNN